MFRHVDEVLRSTIPHQLFFRAGVDPNDTHGHTSARQLYDLSTRSLTSSVLGLNQTDLHRNVSFAMSWLAEPSSGMSGDVSNYLNLLLHQISPPIGPTWLVTAGEQRKSSLRHKASAGTHQLIPALQLHWSEKEHLLRRPRI